MASKELKFVRKNLNPIISHCHDDWNTLHTLTIIRNYDPQLLVHCINTEKYVTERLFPIKKDVILEKRMKNYVRRHCCMI